MQEVAKRRLLLLSIDAIGSSLAPNWPPRAHARVWNRRKARSLPFASLGLTPGTYVWSWGTGLPNQNFMLQIGSVGVPPPGVPDGGTTVSLLGCALLGLVALRRKLSC
jgi:hypothetical protein